MGWGKDLKRGKNISRKGWKLRRRRNNRNMQKGGGKGMKNWGGEKNSKWEKDGIAQGLSY